MIAVRINLATLERPAGLTGMAERLVVLTKPITPAKERGLS
jgi:hypothetical protein